MVLKTRVIPVMLCRGRELVKGERFVNERRVGNAMQAARVHDLRGVDELVMLEVGGDMFDPDVVEELASHCFMPLAVGGGVRTLEQFGLLIKRGADKVVLGRVAFELPELVRQAADKFGSQAVTVSLAYKNASHPFALNGMAQYCQGNGAGEILLQSIDRDGTMTGYDLEVLEEVVAAVSIPVVASAGCRSADNMHEALLRGAHAVAAGALFQFTDETPLGCSNKLALRGWPTRLAA